MIKNNLVSKTIKKRNYNRYKPKI